MYVIISEKDLAEYCTTMLVDTKSGDLFVKDQKYYLLSDVLPEDSQLRRDLQQTRLEQILAHQKLERDDKSYERECLFCRTVVKGTRSDFLIHLHEKHNFYIAKFDNLIFTADLIEKLNDKLVNCICVYCEKVFKDRVILKEHMRKKGHKRINPNNKEYDVFFVSNYLELGKNWQSYLKNVGLKKQRKKSINSGNNSNSKKAKEESSSDSDTNWSDWDEKEITSMVCLLCKHSQSLYSDIITHMKVKHSFDFDALTKNQNFYDKLKMVNYIRRQTYFIRCIECNEEFPNNETLLAHMSTENHMKITNPTSWNQPEFYFSTYEDDGFLFNLEDEEEVEDIGLSVAMTSSRLTDDINISEEVALSVFY